MTKLRIVFMGTPEFAVGILDTILNHNYEIAGVITAADKPAGRGQKIKYSAVKEYALAHNLPLLQPINLKDEAFLNDLKALNANLQIVVAFRMLPKVVWEMPELGTFNLHASLLPDYRGAAPINWAIINGETKTGVTTFFIDDKIDTGALILSAETPITPTENAGELHDKLMQLGSQTVLNTLQKIEQNEVTLTIQEDTAELKTAYKLNKENCKIDWNANGNTIINLIRGLSPYPAAWCFLQDEGDAIAIKIYEAQFFQENHDYTIGTVISNKKEISVAITGGFIKILSVQLPGKKRMKTVELLNGVRFSEQAKVY
ncbi:methionyl-tRNA formyltransferase [Flavobacterium agrisoli]|uniref:Methionyl-tRNA formyltransferase n=1 Tax=Flavobacterium agrisoli TaxID=2793066 RepID=A0A934PQR4_9FLAO|nr:methionyl-tRNA formyltransferase [Flavobacterium agrisoli]MBK0371179.1 methionyl-tRNA formyltransferase [Flavobacterium agrisoli]